MQYIGLGVLNPRLAQVYNSPSELPSCKHEIWVLSMCWINLNWLPDIPSPFLPHLPQQGRGEKENEGLALQVCLRRLRKVWKDYVKVKIGRSLTSYCSASCCFCFFIEGSDGISLQYFTEGLDTETIIILNGLQIF